MTMNIKNRYLKFTKLFYMSILFTYIVFLYLSGEYEIFGFGQLDYMGSNYAVIYFFVILLIVFIYRKYAYHLNILFRNIEKILYSKKIYTILFAILCAVIFFLFRNNFINQDGIAFTAKFYRDVFTKGAHVTHDEMWELYLHSRFWFYTNSYFNWSVNFSYQFLSSIAGGVSIYLILIYCKKLLPTKSLGLFMIIVSGGYMQLFFGDIENYTLTATIIFSYFYSSYRYIKNEHPIIFPSSILAIAMTFHLLSGFLLPSLMFLYFLEFKKRQFKDIFFGVSSFALIIGLTLLFFHYHNLPIWDLYYKSHAFGRGGNVVRMLARPSIQYYISILNLLILLVPAFILILPLVFFRQIKFNDVNIHLGIASIFMILFMFAWKATLGVYNDWNLFAIVAIPISIFIGYNELAAEDMKEKADVLIPTVSIFIIHSYSWITFNHF